MERNKIKKVIKKELLKSCQLKLIYLFGSVLTKDFSDKSDIDIAIFAEDLEIEERIDLLYQLEQVLKQKIDLVNLTEIDTNFAAEIIVSGENIYCEDKDFRAEYEMKILGKYLKLEEDRKIVKAKIYERGSIYGAGSTK